MYDSDKTSSNLLYDDVFEIQVTLDADQYEVLVTS